MVRTILARWFSALLVTAVLIPVTIARPYRYAPPIRSDGIGYHLWTRAILQGDPSFYRYRDHPDVSAFSKVDDARGICQNRYPPGLALLRFPVMAFLVDLRPGAPLITSSEHWASLILAALALSLLCFVVLDTCRRLGCRPWIAHVALLAGVFGTGLFHYGTHDNSFTHVYSALGLALLVWTAVRAREKGEVLPGFLIGALVFFLLLLRATNGIAVVILAAAFLASGGRRTSLVPAGVGAALAATVQLGYNAYANGSLVFSSYGDVGFVLSRTMHLSVLLSYERGLFVYYPVLAVMLISGVAAPKTRGIALAVSAIFGIFALVYGFWSYWALGGGFGHRGFVELVPLAVVVFAVALSAGSARARGLAVAAACLCSVVTLELMLGFWRWTFPCMGATRSVFWSHVVGRESLLRLLGW